ncbi:MAG: glycosyltransferase [Selenomonadaceae bacterium]|nr:glycosyltransferase [Selenomonadaceae bacterium]
MKGDKKGAYCILSSGGWWNQRLLKDCGVIPYLLQKNYNFHSVLVGYNAKPSTLSYLDKYLDGVEIDFLPDDKLETRLQYIHDHAKDIDLLILYGAYPRYVPIVKYYRELRPNGKVYLATDANTHWMDRIDHDAIEWRQFLNQCDVIAASCRKTQRYLSIKWSAVIELIRNGWYNFADVNFDNVFNQKENIILTVGRIGSVQKRTELLLETFAACYEKIPDWRVRLVGKIEKNFDTFLENFFDRFPQLKNKIEFTGLIEDKKTLMEEYKKTKIFTITSDFEGGTPNVIAEALHAGCYIITSDVDGALDATDEGKCGSIFPVYDPTAFADILKRVCNDKKLIKSGGLRAFEYARESFDAENIVDHLYYLLYNIKMN